MSSFPEGGSVIGSPGRIAVYLDIDEHASMVSVRLAGEVDLAAEPVLSDVAWSVASSGCHTVSVDLAEVTFAGASLLNFLIRVIKESASGATVTVRNAPWMTHRLIDLAALGPMVGFRPRPD